MIEERRKERDHQGKEGNREEATGKFNKQLQKDKTRQIKNTHTHTLTQRSKVNGAVRIAPKDTGG